VTGRPIENCPTDDNDLGANMKHSRYARRVKALRLLAEADISEFRNIRFVLTDMDETLTFRGRLGARLVERRSPRETAGRGDVARGHQTGIDAP
jgi:hypothetical protein